jgi:hypothetical protein
MTQDEIIEMARLAGFEGCAELTWENVICTEELVAFAKLVAEHEREACANTAGLALLGADKALSDRVLKAIRARGQA